jgi:hypothetical protein
MPRGYRRYRGVWEDQATLSSDYLQTNWRAFDGASRKIQPDGYDVAEVTEVEVAHDAAADTLALEYRAKGARKTAATTETVALRRQACRFGGSRVLFVAPCCRRSVRTLALMPGRVLCRRCARLTYKSKRKSGVPSLVWKADRIAGRLQCENWYGPISKRPSGMPRSTFDRLADEHTEIVQEVHRRVQPRLWRARRRGQAAYWGALLRAGL